MAISTKKKQRVVSKEDILMLVDDYQIFRSFLGDFPINRKFSNHLRGDENPSTIIRNIEEKLIMTDYGDSNWNGDCFNMVKCAHSCDYNTALKLVDERFGLGLFSGTPTIVRKEYKKPQVKPSLPVKIFTRTCKTNKIGDGFLARFHLTMKDMNFCADTKVNYIDQLVINYQKQWVGKLGIEYKLKNWRKIYRPYASAENKWRSNIPFTEMHGVGNIRDCEIGVVTKSGKEGAFIHKYLIPNVEYVQAESYDSMTAENKQRLKQSCKRLFISWDNDPTGVKECIKLTQELECEYINPPKNLLEKGITDWTDWAEHSNPQTVIDFWKQKGIL